MLTKISSWILFTSSHIPLFIIFLVNNWFIYEEQLSKNDSTSEFTLKVIGFFIILIIISIVLLLIILKSAKNSSEFVKISKVSKSNEDILTYLFAYMVPFFLLDASKLRELVTFGILFIFVGIISVENDLIYINPTLYIMRYNIYTINNGDILISKSSKSELVKKETIERTSLTGNIYIEVKNK